MKKNINWGEFSPEEFEQICCTILELNDFKNVQWYGRSGGDKGRDIVATKIEEPLPSLQKMTKWVVQCKRYLSKPPSKGEISQFLASAREHKPDNVLLIATCTFSADIKDWVTSIKGEYQFNIFVWEERDLQRELLKNWSEVCEAFPKLRNQGDEVMLYRVQHSDHYFGCDEYLELEIMVRNQNSYEEAVNYLNEFINFVKTNEFILLHEDDETDDDSL
jgi:hypothetical protein